MKLGKKTPAQINDEANKQIKKALRKRKKLKKDDILYDEKLKALNSEIAECIKAKEFATEMVKHPTPVPEYQDNSKRTTIVTEVNVNSKNSKKTNLSAEFGTNNNGSKDTPPKYKKSKVKIFFALIAFIIVLVVVVVLTVKITNCVNGFNNDLLNTNLIDTI